MTPRLWLELGLIAVAAGSGWGYVHQRDERLRAEGRYEVLKVRADSTAKAAAESVAETQRRDSAAAVVLRVETEARAAAERRAARAAERIAPAADSVVAAAAPADSAAVRARVAELQAFYDERDAARLDRIRSDSTIIAELRDLDVTRLAAIASLRTALAASQDAQHAGVATRPGWFERALPKIAIPAAAVGGWLLRGLLKG